MELADAKSGFSKMHHYVEFLQVESQMSSIISAVR